MTSLADLPLHGVAIYNPDLLSKQELIAQFVARRPLLDRLLEDLGRPGTTQHHLVVGQRGMGKTTLLRRLRFAIEDDPKLSAGWLPLTFPEEQYNVARLSDLYLNLVDALGDALDRLGRTREAKELDEARERLPDRNEEERARRALDLLRHGADRVKRRLLLLIDNVDLILDRLKADHWAIRELLAGEPRLLMVGASAVMLESTYEYKAAFYDFFLIHELRGLSEEETREVLLHLAKAGNAPAIERVVNEDPGRIKTFHVLAGGNPRTVVLLYDVLAKGVEGDVRADLERLLDRVTPLYKARFEALPAQSQQIVDALAIHWDPMNAAELAALVRLEVNTVSAQLNRLEKQGIVEKVAYHPGNKAGFQVAERFFNIWYLMRASRRVRQRLIWLVEFLRMLYGREQIRGHAERYLRGPEGVDVGSRMRRAEYGLALAQLVEDGPLRGALESVSVRALAVDRDLRAQLASIIDLEGEDAPLRPMVDRHSAMAEVREKVFTAKVAWDKWNPEEFWNLLGGSMVLGPQAKMAMATNLESYTPTTLATYVEFLEKLDRTMDPAFDSTETVRQIKNAIMSGHVDSLIDLMSNTQAAQAAAMALDAPDVAALAITMNAHNDIDASSARALTEHIPNVSSTSILCTAGATLQRQLHWNDDAETAYRRAIDLDPTLALAWNNLGNVLLHDPSRWHESEAALRQAIALDSQYARPWVGLGDLLGRSLGRYEEAESAYRKAIEIAPRDGWAHARLGNLLERHMGRLEEAEVQYERSIEFAPDESWFLDALAWRRHMRDRLDARAEALSRQAVNLAPGNAYVALTLATILIARGNWSEAEPLLRRFLLEGWSKYHDDRWQDLLVCCREAARSGGAADAVRLLDDLSLTDRFRPLREALAAIAAGSKLPLRRVAPEIRRPAEELLAQLWPQGLD